MWTSRGSILRPVSFAPALRTLSLCFHMASQVRWSRRIQNLGKQQNVGFGKVALLDCWCKQRIEASFELRPSTSEWSPTSAVGFFALLAWDTSLGIVWGWSSSGLHLKQRIHRAYGFLEVNGQTCTPTPTMLLQALGYDSHKKDQEYSCFFLKIGILPRERQREVWRRGGMRRIPSILAVFCNVFGMYIYI